VRLAAFANLPLTTIAQPNYEIGMAAVTMLLELKRQLDGPAQRQALKPAR
jgi:DNA-binding LacI/PurR family transcriptional regulator